MRDGGDRVHHAGLRGAMPMASGLGPAVSFCGSGLSLQTFPYLTKFLTYSEISKLSKVCRT